MSPLRRLLCAIAVAVTAVSVALVPPAAEAAADTTTITFGTHNTLHGTSGYTAFADVIGWQEIDTAAARSRMASALTGYRHCMPGGAASADTISYRSSLFTGGYCGARLTHKGEAHVTPNRYVVYQTLTVKATGVRFTVVDTHFISGAWSGHPERQARWNKHLAVLQDLVADLRAQGLPVLVVGDVNRARTVSLPGLSHYSITGVSGVPIDQMYATNANKVGAATRLAKNGSDHYAYRASASV